MQLDKLEIEKQHCNKQIAQVQSKYGNVFREIEN